MGAGVSYSIRGNHTDLPSTRLAYNEFDLLPDPQYRMYWLFANLQQTLDRCAMRCSCHSTAATHHCTLADALCALRPSCKDCEMWFKDKCSSRRTGCLFSQQGCWCGMSGPEYCSWPPGPSWAARWEQETCRRGWMWQ